jgi:hypothetical protein
MASFTDAIAQFNPYIQQLPVDAMTQVGMYKQAKYDEGVQKVQSYIDNIAGIDVIKPEHKQYLQSKVNELGGKLRSVAAGDFSNQQLVNSVGGMATQIIKDPKIQSYVYNTQYIRKMLEQKDADVKSGKSNPDNTRVFEHDLNDWLSDGDADSSFKGRYDQYFDIDKHVKEQFDAIKPGNWSIDQIYEIDPDTGKFRREYVKDPKTGKPTQNYNLIASKTMKRLKNEGRLPTEVESTLNQIMSDGRVQQQLSISGRARYLGVSGERLAQGLQATKDNLLNKQYDELQGLGLMKSAGYDVQEKIDETLSKIENTEKKYSDLSKRAAEDPEGYKAQIYKDNAIASWTGMYGGIKSSTEYLDNPEWSNNWKMIIEANNNKRHAETLKTQVWMHEDTQKFTANENKLNRANAKEIAMLRGKGKGMIDTDNDGIPDSPDPNAVGAGGILEIGNQPSDQSIINQVETPWRESSDRFADVSDEFTWTSMYGSIPSELKKLNDVVAKTGVSRQEAMTIMLNNAAKNAKSDNGAAISPDKYKAALLNKAIATIGNSPNLNPAMKTLLTKFQNAKTQFDGWNNLRQGFIDDTKKQVGADVYSQANLGKLKPTVATFEGKQFKINPEDWYDMALYYKGHETVDLFSNWIDEGVKAAGIDAEKRLRAKGLGFMTDHVLDTQSLRPLGNGQVATGLFRSGKGVLTTVGSGLKQVFGGQALRPDVDMSQFGQALADINSEAVSKTYKNMAENIKRTLNIDPNYKRSVLTGDKETDNATILDLSRFSMNYADRNANASVNFDGFKDALAGGDFLSNGGTLEAQYIPSTTGKPMVEIIAGDAKGVKGGMVIAEDEAKNMGIPIEGIYEPVEVKMAKSKINRRGATSNGPVTDPQTYFTGDTYFNKSNFVSSKGFGNVDVKANFKGDGTLYYGVFYVMPPGAQQPIIKMTNGNANLQQIMTAVKNISPTEINQLLSNK